VAAVAAAPVVEPAPAPVEEVFGEPEPVQAEAAPAYETRVYETEAPSLPLQQRGAAQAGPAPTEEPLFPQVRYADDRDKKGFFSLFGRSRQEDPAPIRDYRSDPTPVIQARGQTGGSAATAQKLDQAPEEATDDLEIPSFLRRLAN
jgi:cell division protein FtsZ